ncbi:hypothetical protein BMS3Bbin02_00231 [bacterium BMS3Bbin02]|nr:hypothetical protein BMS3Bbin02_00231 [bacterium BMS3Bbin02]
MLSEVTGARSTRGCGTSRSTEPLLLVTSSATNMSEGIAYVVATISSSSPDNKNSGTLTHSPGPSETLTNPIADESPSTFIW